MAKNTDLNMIRTRSAIAHELGVSPATVDQLRQLPGCPIKQLTVNGRLYVNRPSLARWFDSLPAVGALSDQ